VDAERGELPAAQIDRLKAIADDSRLPADLLSLIADKMVEPFGSDGNLAAYQKLLRATTKQLAAMSPAEAREHKRRFEEEQKAPHGAGAAPASASAPAAASSSSDHSKKPRLQAKYRATNCW
jgi:hypothetical protein